MKSGSLLRIATAGSVDDGKSTLIGRLLHDTRALMDDHLAAVKRASERRGDGYTNLALLTDGLRAEREQGITIDVAYRFFATPLRSFILADTPGHALYTRNTVTGLSTSDVAVVLVDARKGILEQTRRHAFIASLLRVGHVVLAVNKMDLVGWDRDTFDAVSSEFETYVDGLPHPAEVRAVPVAALHGDNVVTGSSQADWYSGPTLLHLLETIEVDRDDELGARLSVQWVIRPMSDHHHDYRGYAGRLVGGALRPGDEVAVLPSGQRARVRAIDVAGCSVSVAVPGQAITVRLDESLDVGRGDVIVAVAAPVRPSVGTAIDADVCWMGHTPLVSGGRYFIKHLTSESRAVVAEVLERRDVENLKPLSGVTSLELNELGRIRLRTSRPVVADPYRQSRITGRFVLVDEQSDDTVAAGMIREVS